MTFDLVRLSLLGGLLGLDGTSAGQFMLSRPLVAGALAGWLLGDPASGVAVGAVLELYLLVSFPTGGARFPEGPTATVVAVGTALLVEAPGALPLGIALGLVWGRIGGATVTLHRKTVTRILPEPADPSAARLLLSSIVRALAMDFARAVTVTATGLVAGVLGVGFVAPHWPLGGADSLALLVVGGATSAGILLHDLGGLRARAGWFAVGLALGLVGVALR